MLIENNLSLDDVDLDALLANSKMAERSGALVEQITRKCSTWGDVQNLPALFGTRVVGYDVYQVVQVINENLHGYLASEPATPDVAAEPEEEKPKRKSRKKKTS